MGTTNAQFNFRNRHPPPCDPDTHIPILTEISEWISQPTSGNLVYLLYGIAGSGKSAVAQSVSQNCDERGVLAASFFFNCQDKDRSSTNKFVATIAYQLTISIPSLKDPILDTFRQDDTILQMVMVNQFQKLIIQPLRSLPESDSSLVIVIDALDECTDSAHVADLMALLSRSTSNLRLRFPLRIFITTCPKHHIRAALAKGPSISSSNLELPKDHVKFKLVPFLLPPLLYKITCVSLCLTLIIAALWVWVYPVVFTIWVTPTACLLNFAYHGAILSIDHRKRWSDVWPLTASATVASLTCIFLLNFLWISSLGLTILVAVEGIPLWMGVTKSILNVFEVVVLVAIMIRSALERKRWRLGIREHYRRSVNNFP